MTEAGLLNRLKRFGYGQHHGPMAKACSEAADEIERLRAALRAIVDYDGDPLDMASNAENHIRGIAKATLNQQEPRGK
jgi:hypothetical protein